MMSSVERELMLPLMDGRNAVQETSQEASMNPQDFRIVLLIVLAAIVASLSAWQAALVLVALIAYLFRGRTRGEDGKK